MKQFNKTTKCIAAFIILLFCAYQSYAQPSSYYPDRYIRNWRLYSQDYSLYDYQTTFSANNKIYHLIQDSTYYDASIGGFVAVYFPRFKAFDIAANQWNRMADFPGAGRSYGSSFTIGNDVYFGLGNNRVTYQTIDSSFYKYNTTTNTWSSIAAFPNGSWYNAIGFSLNGKGYVVGGQHISPTYEASQQTFEYNPTTDSWAAFDDIPASGGILVFTNHQVFTHNNKAYILYISNVGNELWEFDPSATTGNQWTQKTAPPNNYYVNFYNYGLFETKKGCLIMGGSVEYYDTANNYVNKFNDTAYNYDAANDVWELNYCTNQFQNYNKTFTINNEAFVFSASNSDGLNLGYNEQPQYSGYYYSNAYASTPLDTVFVHHNFKGVCENSTPTVTYNVSTAMNTGNQFVFVITREDGLILDTVATANGTTGGSQQISIPSITALKNKALQLGLGNYGVDFGKLKLAVLTTNPRTIFANQSTTFSLIDDPANLSPSINGLNADVCSNIAPLGIKFNGLLNYNFQGTLNIPKTDLSINWVYGNGVDIPSDDTTDVLYANDSTLNYIETTLRIDYKLFCNNHDTTYSYGANSSISKYTNNSLLADVSAQEGNSLCGNNETKHIITKVIQEGVDSCWGYRKLFKNGVRFYDDSVMLYANYYYSGYEGGLRKDTFTVNGINDNDEIELEFTTQANKCDANSRATLIRKLIFKKYQNSLSNNIHLKLKFDNNLTDSSANHNNGIGQNIGFTTNRFGKPNSALQIVPNTNPATASEVVTTSNINIDSNSNRTVSFWFKTDSSGYNYGGENSPFYPSRPGILGWGSFITGSDANFFHIEPKTKAIIFRGHYNDLVTDSNIFKFNEWTHVAFTLNDNFANLYVNGKCVKAVLFKSLYQYSYTDSAYSITGNGFSYSWFNSTLNTTNSPLRIGNDGNGIDLASDWKYPFHGGVDDILIYNKAMTACQVDSLYRMTESNCTPTSSTINAAICQGTTYHFKNKNIATAGTYKDTLRNAGGCDSIITLNLTVKQQSSSAIDRTFCDGSSYNFNGKILNTAGTHYDTLQNAVGCDSIITLNLTKSYPSNSTTIVYLCSSGFPYIWNGTTYTTYGNDVKHFTNGAGCDSAAYLELRRKPFVTGHIYDTVCSNQLPYVFDGINLNAGGNWQSSNYLTAAGCDTNTILHLFVKQASSHINNIVVCSSYTWNGTTYTSSGIYYKTLTNAVGCDSILTLNLTIKQPSSSIINITKCISYVWGATTYTQTGTYTKNSLINAAGCDSTATLNLIIKQPSSKMINDTIISGSDYSFNGNNYTTAGSYTATLVNDDGCDSVVTLNLYVKPGGGTPITGNFVGCSFITTNTLRNSTSGGNWRSSNTNVATINQVGVVTNISNGITTITYTYYKNGLAVTSTVNYTVAVVPVPAPIVGPGNICVGVATAYNNATAGGVWSVYGRGTVTNNGVVTATSGGSSSVIYTVTNSVNCGASVSLPVTFIVNPAIPNIAYSGTGTNPQAGAPAGSMCRNRTFGLVGYPSGGVWGTTGVFSVTNNGSVSTGTVTGSGTINYTIQSVDGCSSIKTFAFNVVACASRGINDNQSAAANFIIYPNPAHSVFNIKTDKLTGFANIVITDLYGKQILKQVVSAGINSIVVSDFAKGVYFVSLIKEQNSETKKLVIE